MALFEIEGEKGMKEMEKGSKKGHCFESRIFFSSASPDKTGIVCLNTP
jgi:hypothetical protein